MAGPHHTCHPHRLSRGRHTMRPAPLPRPRPGRAPHLELLLAVLLDQEHVHGQVAEVAHQDAAGALDAHAAALDLDLDPLRRAAGGRVRMRGLRQGVAGAAGRRGARGWPRGALLERPAERADRRGAAAAARAALPAPPRPALETVAAGPLGRTALGPRQHVAAAAASGVAGRIETAAEQRRRRPPGLPPAAAEQRRR